MNRTHKQMLKVLCLGQLMIETLDSIKGTNEYKHLVKKNTNQYIKFLEKHMMKHIDDLYSDDENIMHNIITNTELFINTDLDKFISDIIFAKGNEVQKEQLFGLQ